MSVCVHVSVSVLDHPGIDNIPQIEMFQEKAYMELQDYVTRTYPEDSYRLVLFISTLIPCVLKLLNKRLCSLPLLIIQEDMI